MPRQLHHTGRNGENRCSVDDYILLKTLATIFPSLFPRSRSVSILLLTAASRDHWLPACWWLCVCEPLEIASTHVSVPFHLILRTFRSPSGPEVVLLASRGRPVFPLRRHSPPCCSFPVSPPNVAYVARRQTGTAKAIHLLVPTTYPGHHPTLRWLWKMQFSSPPFHIRNASKMSVVIVL